MKKVGIGIPNEIYETLGISHKQLKTTERRMLRNLKNVKNKYRIIEEHHESNRK